MFNVSMSPLFFLSHHQKLAQGLNLLYKNNKTCTACVCSDKLRLIKSDIGVAN